MYTFYTKFYGEIVPKMLHFLFVTFIVHKYSDSILST